MTRPKTAENSTLFLVPAKPARTKNRECSRDLLDIYGEAMEQALGIEKASLSAMVGVNSYALDLYEQVVGGLIGVAIHAGAFYAQAQLSWLTLMAPGVYGGREALSPVAAPAGMVAGRGEDHTPLTGEALERSMDVAFGTGSEVLLPAAAPSLTVASGMSGEARPEDGRERGMDVVIGTGNAA